MGATAILAAVIIMALFAFSWYYSRPWRFSVRDLLIITTLLAIGLVALRVLGFGFW